MVVFACTDSQYNFNAMVYYIDKVKPDKGHGFEYDDHGLCMILTCCLPDHPGHWWSLCDWLLSRKCLLVTLSLSLSLWVRITGITGYHLVTLAAASPAQNTD